ncbi:RagB/SusD family nutrient uptake outer membrane protein [Pedobacter sp. JY14-1]|uniref:RagB/SusD family nutrient uptake outer membrane protein n=1 Tax=Pedobacter sp. JY14-1 TaxID=3034151 RepID=UPI0023E1E067|nr:RagB/SusD family nutrient uptake outer membrane protein [Pedobacter sp. JY14-1]
MKIYNIKYKTLALVVVLGMLMGTVVSCKKALENELSNDTYADSFWKSENDVQSAVLGAYGLFRKSLHQNSCFFIWGDVPVGMFNSDQGTLATNLVTTGSFTVPYWEEGAHNWTNWYRVVDASNLVIENVNRMSDDVFSSPQAKNAYLGEAYFLRAMAYFYMTKVWGDVPLQLTATTSADQAQKLGRTEAATIIKQVIADAQKASSLLTFEQASTYQKRRASKGAALALLAHASAWANDYTKTIAYADSLINRTDLYHLQPQGAILDVFSQSAAPENIFVLTAKSSDNEAAAYTDYIFTANVAFLTVSSEQKAGMPYNPAYYYVPVEMTNTLYESGDARKTEFFYESNGSGTLKQKLSLKKYANIAYKNAASSANPLAESNLVIFRLADMLLLKAEALNALGNDQEAIAAALPVRTRAGVAGFDISTDYGSALKRKIMQERERELVGEGHNYFDVVRNAVNSNSPAFFGQIIGSWSMSADRYNQKGYLWPIANSILNANRLISQNPWWMGKL